MKQLSLFDVHRRALEIFQQLEGLPHRQSDDPLQIHGVPRGGIIPAIFLTEHLADAGFHVQLTENPTKADIIVDDILDSGSTRRRYKERFPSAVFITFYSKSEFNEWVVFPWEKGDGGGDIVTRLLQYIGEDPSRGGLQETPTRVLNAWKFWTSGYQCDPASVLKTFEDGADKYDEMVLVKNIPVYSQCEHHLAPFFGVAHVAYIPNGKIVGLSKLSRLVDIFARRLQVQERLTNQVVDALNEHLDPLGAGVILNCRHLCMESRGICQQGHSTITSALRGEFKDNLDTRNEFLKLTQ